MMSDRLRGRTLGLDRFSGLYLWALFIIVFSIWVPKLFPTAVTAHSLASSEAVPAMLGLAVVIPLAAGIYDLSVGATVNLSAILAVWLQSHEHWGMWPAIIVAVAACAVIGVINGYIVVRLHVSSFITTLGMGTIVTATQTIISGNTQPLPPSSNAWGQLTQTSVWGFQIVFFYLLVMALIVWWLLEHTPPGRYVFAIGGNADAARLSGVPVDRYSWLTLVASSTIAGIAGVLYGSLFGPSLTFGSSLLLPAFAAAFLGSTQFKPGRFNTWGGVLAIYVLATGVKGLQFVTNAQWLNDMFNGVALIVAVAFAVGRQRAAGRRKTNAGRASIRSPDGEVEAFPGHRSAVGVEGVPPTVETSGEHVHLGDTTER